MRRIDNFLSEVYSEEIFSVSESEYDEVMAEPTVDDDWQGYSDWSKKIEEFPFTEGDLENFEVRDGKVYHKPQPPQRERIQGIEI